MLFPFNKPRIYQEDFMKDVELSIENKKILLANAPTGIGKTAAVLSVIIPKIINSNLKVFFVTPRNIQHRMIVDTIKLIEKKFKLSVPYQTLIGKKNLCLKAKDNVDVYEYCKILRENDECEYYRNSKKINIVERDISKLVKISKEMKVCPYEVALNNIRNSNLIIGNYNHIFNENVRKYIFSKGNLSFEDLILVVDEAQNLPKSISNVYSKYLSVRQIKNAINEANRYNLDIVDMLENLESEVSEILKSERVIEKNEIRTEGYDLLIEYGDKIRSKVGKSYVGSVGEFLEMWRRDIENFKRLSYENKIQYLCIDPSIISGEIFDRINSGILMSGTLRPLRLYRDLLGIKRSILKEYKNPFPISNRKLFIVSNTTTRYIERNKKEYEKIANLIKDILNKTNGGGIIFFPSYKLMKDIIEFIGIKDNYLVEKKDMKQTEKEEYLNLIKKGYILFAVMRSNFYEGVNLPNVLKFIIIVGLPLPKPDIKTKVIMNYFEKKFGDGFKYAYILPTANTIRQAIGRMIRNETDKGIAILIDKRYNWKRYKDIIPNDWMINYL